MNRYIYFFCVGILMSLGTKAQSSFIQQQLNFPRVADAFKLKEDLLRREFAEKGLNWPADELYIRSFKYDGQLEVWVRSNHQKTFQLFKQYPVCKLSGVLGPKRREGDLQVPEGFYSIIELNPLSQFHLSLGLNYPNSADKINGDQQRPGGDIYIHGKCATVGCIPIQDDQIEELYVLVAHAENKGQQNIPVHIFPVKLIWVTVWQNCNRSCRRIRVIFRW